MSLTKKFMCYTWFWIYIIFSCRYAKYDLLAGELSNIYKYKARIIPYVMTREGVVSTYHRKYVKELDVQPNVEAYMQFWVLKKTLENVSFGRRRIAALEDMVLLEPAAVVNCVPDPGVIEVRGS